MTLPPVGSVDHDPVAAWDGFAASVQAVLDDPATRDGTFHNPHTGDLPLADAVSLPPAPTLAAALRDGLLG